ncbi:MAG TPA: thiamine biosynthesis protein ThiF [Planctomycetaceae bacterium]|nr:thiamine biosynthesis protein ThiF [Planctomycetaceae bacterium]
MTTDCSGNFDRYRKQTLFSGIGEAGQKQLQNARVAIVGCGALGSVLAETLARAGVGYLRIIDRDFVDLSNLQRQHLFDEDDVLAHLPKAIAAQKKLRRINSEIVIESHVEDLHASNIEQLLASCTLIMDGTDNFETRFLLNDYALESNTPWISGGVIAARGQVFTVIPHRTACLRCILEEEPPQTETCDTAGVIGPAVNVIASLQATRALQWIASAGQLIDQRMTIVDLWEGSFQQIDLSSLSDNQSCPACNQHERLWLRGERTSQSTILCGRNAVQISPSPGKTIDLKQQQQLWDTIGSTKLNPFLLWFQPADQPEIEIHLFQDRRAIIKGTEDLNTAKTLYSRYLGS